MVNYTNNFAKKGTAGLVYSSNEYIDILIANANFENNFILNYQSDTNAQVKSGHFFIEKANSFTIIDCNFMPYNKEDVAKLQAEQESNSTLPLIYLILYAKQLPSLNILNIR